MDLTIPDAALSELAAAFFQATIALGLVLLCAWAVATRALRMNRGSAGGGS